MRACVNDSFLTVNQDERCLLLINKALHSISLCNDVCCMEADGGHFDLRLKTYEF